MHLAKIALVNLKTKSTGAVFILDILEVDNCYMICLEITVKIKIEGS